jgi:hypothetical protein
MKKILALVAALAVAAPLLATAQPVPENDGTAQKVQQTYHTQFQNGEAEAGR